MKCPNCGAKMKETDRVCPACGKAQDPSASAAKEKPTAARGWIALVLILAGLLAAGAILYPRLAASFRKSRSAGQHGASASPQSAEPGSAEAYHLDRDFTVTDAEGNRVRLSDFAGKPVVVNYWATWCGYCVSELDEFERAWETYGDRVAFLMVDLTDGSYETVKTARAFLEQKSYRFPDYYDTLFEAQQAYSVSAIPVTLVLDAAGNQVALHIGAIDGDELDSLIRTALGETAR